MPAILTGAAIGAAGSIGGGFLSGRQQPTQHSERYGGTPGFNFPFFAGVGEIGPLPTAQPFGPPQPTNALGFRSGYQPYGSGNRQGPAIQGDPNKVPVSAVMEYYDFYGPAKKGDVQRLLKDHGLEGATDLSYEDAQRIFGGAFGGASGRSKGLATGVVGYTERRRQAILAANRQAGYQWNEDTEEWDYDQTITGQPAPLSPMSQATADAYQNGTATGLSWDPKAQRWIEATGNPEIVYDGETDTNYYLGQPVSKDQMNQIMAGGPGGPQMMGQLARQIQGGVDWERDRQAPQVQSQYSGQHAALQLPGREGDFNLPGREEVSHVQQMLQMIRDQGFLPTGLEEEWKTILERPPQIGVDPLEKTDIDYDVSEKLLESLIKGQTQYTEMLLKEQRDEALARYNERIAGSGTYSSGAAAFQAERDVMKPHNDRIFANRSQVTHRAFEQWEGAKMAVAFKRADISLQEKFKQFDMDFNVQKANVGFLTQTIIAEADMNSRIRGQIGVAGMQAETQRRGQSLSALAGLQSLQTNAAITQRGQDIQGRLTARAQDVTQRGQDIGARVTERGQDIQAGQEAGRQSLTAQNSNLTAWLNILGMDKDVAMADMQFTLSLFSELRNESQFQDRLALDAYQLYEANRLGYFSAYQNASQRTMSEAGTSAA